jgi:hypothetical protein
MSFPRDSELAPDGQISAYTQILSSPFRKNFPLFFRRKSLFCLMHPVPLEGRIAIVTDVGAGCGGRSSVKCACDRRATQGVPTNGAAAYGEVVWSRRPDAGVKFLRSESFSRMTVARKPVTGESTKETVKTIAQETPGVPVNLW